MSSNLSGNLHRPAGLDTEAGGATELFGPRTGGVSVPAGVDAVSNRWLLGAKVHLASGTRALADDFVRTDGGVYEGRVLDFGFIERSITAPSSAPTTGDCLIRIADHDQQWRTLASQETFIRKLLELVRITDQQVIGGFEITDVSFGDAYVELRGTDLISKSLKKKIPPLGNRDNFPWMIEGVDEFFMNIIVGEMFSPEDNPQGMIPCDHMGPTTKTTGGVSVDRYCIARHLINGPDVVVVYRKLISDAAFAIVDSSEYVITYDEAFTVDDFYHTPTYLDFLNYQESDAEIRVDTYGALRGGVIGSFYNWDDPNPIRYPIDALSIVLWELGPIFGGETRNDRYNTESLQTVLDYCVANDIFFDGAICESTTPLAFIEQLQTNFEGIVHFYVNRRYQIEVASVVAENTDRPVATDKLDNVSVTPKLAVAPFNRFFYRYKLNPSSGEYNGSGTYNKTDDQAALGEGDYQGNANQPEVEYVDLYYISDQYAALGTIIRRSAMQALGSHRALLTLPLPNWFERLELAGLIGVTHYGGIGAGGWVNEEFKILSIRHNLKTLKTAVEVIKRLPLSYS